MSVGGEVSHGGVVLEEKQGEESVTFWHESDSNNNGISIEFLLMLLLHNKFQNGLPRKATLVQGE